MLGLNVRYRGSQNHDLTAADTAVSWRVLHRIADSTIASTDLSYCSGSYCCTAVCWQSRKGVNLGVTTSGAVS